jgi:hypothetical protein
VGANVVICEFQLMMMIFDSYQSAQQLVTRWQRKFSTIQDTAKGLPINAFNEFTLAAFDIIGKAG